MCFARLLETATRIQVSAPHNFGHNKEPTLSGYIEHLLGPEQMQRWMRAMAEAPTLGVFRIRTRNALDGSDLFLHPTSTVGGYILAPEQAGPLALWPACTVLNVCAQLTRRYWHAFRPSHCQNMGNCMAPTAEARAAVAQGLFQRGKDVRHKMCCANCYKQSGRKLKACGGCSLVCYCSETCQREHWQQEHSRCCVSRVSNVSKTE